MDSLKIDADLKHRKNITEPLSADYLALTLDNLAQIIMTLDYKQQHILNDWLVTWGNYLTFENAFDPRKLVYYKRGDIVLAHFGYNVGSEQGGIRYAVVVEIENNIMSGVVMVVPLSSLEKGKTKDDLHKSEVFIGKLIDGVDCYAMPLQMRTISKLRIIKPKHKKHKKTKIPSGLLDIIDEQIKVNFTKYILLKNQVTKNSKKNTQKTD